MSIIETVAVVSSGIAVCEFIIIVWDRLPHVKVHIKDRDIVEEVGKDRIPARTGRGLDIEIANRSTKRILITSLNLEWCWYPDVPFRNHRTGLTDLQRIENGIPVEAADFWIDVWGVAKLNANVEGLERSLYKELTSHSRRLNHHRKISYWVQVCAGYGECYRSNKILFYIPRFEG